MHGERDPEEWNAIHDLFQTALDLPAGERERFLMVTCSAPHVRANVEALLEAADAADPWLDRASALVGFLAREAFADGAELDVRYGSAAVEDDQRIGSYRIVRTLARGGMGTVHLAERADGQFEHRVALKLLRRGLDTDDIVERFLAERQILAKLSHPNIARLLDGGAADDGRPYLVLEFVEGEPITAFCDTRRLSVEARLELFVTACRAVQHAHEHLVLHRDIKPSNILVTTDRRVKLLDFGIAKILDESGKGARTRTGAMVMTPDYASPEQLRGGELTTGSDIFQLGLLLFELLAGGHPYRVKDRSVIDLERDLRNETLPAPSKYLTHRNSAAGSTTRADEIARARGTDPHRLRRALRGDLDAIIRKALRSDPSERYGSVAALIEDLERHGRGHTVRARRGTIGYRARKLVRRKRSTLAVIAGLASGFFALAGAIAYSYGREEARAVAPDTHAVAVGQIRAYDADAASRTAAARDMLATSLSRIHGITVLGPTRMTELVAQIMSTGDTVAAAHRAAGLGGATVLIEGALRQRASGYRLDLQWIELGSGRIRQTFTVDADDVFALADQAAASVAEAYDLRAPSDPTDRATAPPDVVFRFYEEGVRAFYRGDRTEAKSFLRAAVAEDSTFPLASLFLGLATPEHAPRIDYLSRALRFAGRASERDRLLIRAIWAREIWDPSLSVLADSLVALYPAEPDGHYLIGLARVMDGNFLAAIPHLERAVAMDSLGLESASLYCLACDALTEMITALVYADSFPAAERAARRWVRRQPESARAWDRLAWTLYRQDRFEEAVAARQTAAAQRIGDPHDEVYPAAVAVRQGDFATADRILRERIRYGTPPVRTQALYWLTLSLRYQGRVTDALETARSYRRSVAAGVSDLTAGGQEAQVLFEMGRFHEAAALFDSISSQPWSEHMPARNASRRLRGLTPVAGAWAASGDLTALASLADDMAILGEGAGIGIYRLMHHYPRGLLLAAQGRTEDAIDQLQRSIFSAVSSHQRPKLALARVLIDAGRPWEAVPVLQAALRGPTTGPGSYVTRTELYELLGRAWDEAGQPDSAAVHYRHALSAWEYADPQFDSRREFMRQRLSEFARPLPRAESKPPAAARALDPLAGPG